jgi:hypothetical protein
VHFSVQPSEYIICLQLTSLKHLLSLGFYLTEKLLAKSMGLSMQDLNFHFGQIYNVHASGSVHIPDKPPKQIQKPYSAPQKTQNQNQIIDFSGRLKKDKNRILKISNDDVYGKSSDSSARLIVCPFCDSYVSNDKNKISQHIKKKHPGK